ncbi:MAG: hypothetical protein ACE5PO_01905 [Candidatus Bathyarchaeia archaeon]
MEVKCECGHDMAFKGILCQTESEIEEGFQCPMCHEIIVVWKDRSAWEHTFAGD